MQTAVAERFDDGLAPQYYEAFKGKKVAFVPISMGFDLTQGWMAAVQRDADRLGYELIIRDPNWSIDAGAQALEQLIIEKPDIIIFHNNDMQAYAKLVTRAMAEGINVIQVNLKTPVNGDYFVGADLYGQGQRQLEETAKLCGPDTSGKIALIQGPVTSPPSQIGLAGINDALAGHSNLSVVSTQAADWDASKAHSIASTVLKQHPDLCAIIGFWDNQDIGAAAAIREAGLTGKVHLVTAGGGNVESACNNIANGSFSSYVTSDTRHQAYHLAVAIQSLLQTKPEPGSKPIGLYTEVSVITKDNMTPSSCWTVDQIKAGH
ncbi:sugar ABC transporter substrate-binding protein [Aquibium sp. LZ166]|uniref:Sugar ABC transporter substrate-binding protein n=1 Tax=Aquibium pacificus TaxID=3153579 RepID=A0ABV3SET4_9HYPH